MARKLLGAAGLIALAIAAHANAATMERTVIKTTVPLPAFIFYPEQTSAKVPVMILVHGSKGIAAPRIWEQEKRYAEDFARMGIATVLVDLFTPRGIANTIRDQSQISALTMTKDTIGVLKSLKDNPRIDISRSGVMGFSKGGSVVLNLALTAFSKEEDPYFSVFIAMYPYCGNFRYKPAAAKGKLAIILGEKDTYASQQLCRDYAAFLGENGIEGVEMKVIPGAYHAWDIRGPAYRSATGENFSNCRFREDADGNWTEQTSRLVVATRSGPTPDRPKALKSCVTHTVSWGYSESATDASTALVRRYVRLLQE